MNTILCFALLSLLLLNCVFIKGDTEAEGQAYLNEVAKRDGAITLNSGMIVEILTQSTDPNAKSPTAKDKCKVTYEGTFKSGKRFDGSTTTFAPNQVISGWTEAMQYMVEGDKWRLHIPYDLAYGKRGRQPKIPGYAVLVFDIEIHQVLSGGKEGTEAKAMFQKAIKEPEL